ncbi:MAG: PHP domain-containing protein [Treponemataceae bacterium]|nr:PHP domain-containing protein [Treponemataceae bacterium]
MIDLHTHSTASDGQYAPAALVRKAQEKGISVLALTDHDTADGLAEAAAEAERAGVVFVPGIELNISFPTGEFHLLGLGLRTVSPSLAKIIAALQAERNERNEAVAERLRAAGIAVSLADVQREFPGKVLGRPHFAAWLERHKVVRTRQAAFDKYLGSGRPCYVGRAGADFDDAVAAVYESGGLPVIAHPLSLYLSWGKLESALADFTERGLAGLEAWHPCARVGECEHLERIARSLGLFVTAGSDFHGEEVRRDRRPGHTSGGRKIDGRFWFEELRPALERRQ